MAFSDESVCCVNVDSMQIACVSACLDCLSDFLTNGLALSCPAMSGADPWHGSNTPGPSGFPIEADGSMPREPTCFEPEDVGTPV